MSEKVIELMPKLLSFQHKCKQTKCKQMSEEFENMKKFIVYSNQLNLFYLEPIKDTDNCFGDNPRDDEKIKQNFLKTVESEIRKIDETLQLILNCDKETDLKQNSSKIRCDLCRKQLSTNLLTTHLTEHLDNILLQKKTKHKKSNITIENQSKEQPNVIALEPFCSLEVKEEPNSTSDENRSEISDALDGMDNDFSDSEDETIVSKRTKKSKPKQTSNSPKIRKQREDSKEVVICDECGKTFKGSVKLENHLSRVHSISKKKNSNNCHLCDFGDVTIEELKKHFADEHNLTVNKWNFYCTWPDCGKVCRFKTALDKHYRTHTGDLLHKCEWPGCNVQFNKKWKIVEHRRSHTGEKPFQCYWPGCDRAFGKRATLRGHIRNHRSRSKHDCYFPGCDKTYTLKSSLEEHVNNTHRKEEQSAFICTAEGCGRTFGTRKTLRLHKVKHDNNRRRYYCTHEGCGRSFVEKRGLTKHLAKPHEESLPEKVKGIVKRLPKGRVIKDCKCYWPGCDFEAKSSDRLKLHHMRAHTEEKPHKCDEPGCNFSAVRKCELRIHMMKHTGESPYPCSYPFCGKRFKSQRAVDTHMNKTHK